MDNNAKAQITTDLSVEMALLIKSEPEQPVLTGLDALN